MHRTGLRACDLRILDPLLSYLSAVLGRERAIVINLEHVKAIITAHEVLLLNSRDPSVTPLVEDCGGVAEEVDVSLPRYSSSGFTNSFLLLFLSCG
ncbi:magnesium transporter MRS2-3-like [Populus alba x Populus x berolinensis]|nr:magnesium transporter MRS2-3-like [Populus alba x Populus x berolinensis]